MLKRAERIAVFGDSYGLPMVLKELDTDSVVCMVAASIRPQYHDDLYALAGRVNKPLFIQPARESLKYHAFVEQFRACSPDLVLCNSYSMIIQNDLLAIVKGFGINFHASKLPKNRGPNPIQWALIKNEKISGVTAHFITETVDAGDIVAQEEVEIQDSDTWLTLRSRLSEHLQRLMQRVIPDIVSGQFSRTPQDGVLATSNSRLNPESPKIDFSTMSDRDVFNLIRAQVSPLAGAFVDAPGGRVHFPEYVPEAEVGLLRDRYYRK